MSPHAEYSSNHADGYLTKWAEKKYLAAPEFSRKGFPKRRCENIRGTPTSAFCDGGWNSFYPISATAPDCMERPSHL
jgi:hypothetical protein